MSSINKACTSVETGFNIAGSIPVIAIFSGALRHEIGIIQGIAGGLTALGASLAQVIEASRSHPNPATMAKLKRFKQFGMQHLIHGALNALRGLSEALLGYFTLGIGNLVIFLPYNLCKDPKFSPVYEYFPANKNVTQRA